MIWGPYQNIDPRLPVLGILFLYLALGLTVLGFNRTPLQILTTSLSCCTLEVVFCYLFKRKIVFPLSALITSFSLSFLLNYTHDFFLLFAPLFFAIGSKYIFQFDGRHKLNPAMAGVSFFPPLHGRSYHSSPRLPMEWNCLPVDLYSHSGAGLCHTKG